MGCTSSKLRRPGRNEQKKKERQDDSDKDEEASDEDNETFEARPQFERQRGLATCPEVYGAWNKKTPFKFVEHNKNTHQKRAIRTALRSVIAFQALPEEDITALCDATSIMKVGRDECVVKCGDHEDALYVVLLGAIDVFEGEKILFQDNVVMDTLVKGHLIGQDCMIFNSALKKSYYGNPGGTSVLGVLERDFFLRLMTKRQTELRNERQALLRGTKLLEALKEEDIARLAEVVEPRKYKEGDPIITQGEKGSEFYVMTAGEAVVEIESGWFAADIQEHRRYYRGDLFGERALLTGDRRAASVIACSEVEVLVMSRRKFERLLGPMSLLQADLYLTDPRKIIADFYSPGDHNGPGGALKLLDLDPGWCATTWFAVYRPTSRDAIAKMLSGDAVGKGLNIKGKSAKKGVLSGFVPFIQISDNEHKSKVENPEAETRLWIFFKTQENRETVIHELQAVMAKWRQDHPSWKNRTITQIDDWKEEPYAAFGIECSEAIMHEAYIMMPDLSPITGWETGRASEPAFMDMNLHAIRGKSLPKIVLYQYDAQDPMNPRGLLVAYAEKYVKPVVSDFDTFTIGSTNMLYAGLPDEQVEIAEWSLEMSEEVLAIPGNDGWNSRWLRVLERENAKGFHPVFPKYGFGDPISYKLIGQVVEASLSCGAIRHGAECFNFYFPQELDDEYLVVWEKFPDLPWAYKTEPELRKFLLNRIEEGYSFPLNPVWPIRDKGWYTVMDALRKKRDTMRVMHNWSWWSETSTISRQIDTIHHKYPEGFVIGGSKPPPPPKISVSELPEDPVTEEGDSNKSSVGSGNTSTSLRDLEEEDAMAEEASTHIPLRETKKIPAPKKMRSTCKQMRSGCLTTFSGNSNGSSDSPEMVEMEIPPGATVISPDTVLLEDSARSQGCSTGKIAMAIVFV